MTEIEYILPELFTEKMSNYIIEIQMPWLSEDLDKVKVYLIPPDLSINIPLGFISVSNREYYPNNYTKTILKGLDIPDQMCMSKNIVENIDKIITVYKLSGLTRIEFKAK